jgi:hypothetical protein
MGSAATTFGFARVVLASLSGAERKTLREDVLKEEFHAKAQSSRKDAKKNLAKPLRLSVLLCAFA